MKSKRQMLILICLLAVGFVGCDGFFGANVFSVVETNSGVDVSELLTEDRLSDLAAVLESESTYEQMTAADVAQAEAFLLDIVGEPAGEQARATASEALTALYRNTTTAGAAVDSVSPLIDALLAENEGSGGLSAEELIEAFAPPAALENQSAFDDMISAFFDLDAAYHAMNQALGEPQVAITAAGAAFQGALVTHIVTESVAAMDIDGNPATEESVGAKTVLLYKGLTGDEDDAAALENALAGFSAEQLIAASSEEGAGIENIVEEAGFASLLSSLVGSASEVAG